VKSSHDERLGDFWLIEDRGSTGRPRCTITSEVIAAPRDLFEIEEADVAGLPRRCTVIRRIPMPTYQIHTIASAPEQSKPALEQFQEVFGVIPNIAASIANSPKLVTALSAVFQQVHSSSLTEREIQIVLLTDAVANSCTYAVAFHTSLALQQGVSSEETGAIRSRLVPRDRRFAALSTLAKTLIEKRGHLNEQDRDGFIAAGFTEEQILEVIGVVAASTITNYAGTVANPPLEERYQQYAWRG
jgi:AhpD family alkylhydroperoxidase